MLLADSLSLALRLFGVDSVCVERRLLKRYSRYSGPLLLQRIAVDILLRRVGLVFSECRGAPIALYKGVAVLAERGAGLRGAARLVGRIGGNDVAELLERIRPRTPKIVIDMLMWEVMSESEKREFFKQLLVLLSVVRNYLFDDMLALAPTPPEVTRWASRAGLHSRVVFAECTASQLLKRWGVRRVVVLDPYAPKPLGPGELTEADAFILGGVIDKEFVRPYATYAIYLLEEFERRGIEAFRRRLELWGSVVGVPDRLNKVVEVVLKARMDSEPLDTAILSTMSFSDKVSRLLHEVQRAGKGEVVCIDDVYRAGLRLGLGGDELERAVRKVARSVGASEC